MCRTMVISVTSPEGDDHLFDAIRTTDVAPKRQREPFELRTTGTPL